MSTSSILPQSTTQAEAAQTPMQQLAAALKIAAGSGRVLHVLCSQWSDGRISYRISIEKGSKMQIVHRLFDERATTGINDLLWTLCEQQRWAMRPTYQGSGFICFDPIYRDHLRRQSRTDDVL